MSEMIERVARASFACWRKRMDDLGLHQDKGRDFEDMNESEHEFALMNAKAMIAAMREPTKAMCKAGAERHMVSNLEEEAKIKYQWMIDEALKKK